MVSGNTPPDSFQIIEAIADHRETNPLELDFALGEQVNPEALETVLDANVEEIQITFTINGMVVTVANDGTISVVDAE